MDKILPTLLAWVTGKSRYKPDIKWSNKSIVHNLFRLHELIFWRSFGIRAEVSATRHGTKKVQYFHSVEGALAVAESYVRAFLYELRPVKIEIYTPAMATNAGFLQPPTPYLFAIATDATASGSFGGSPDTWTHTCTGSDRILFVCEFNQSSSISASYNSVSMTSLGGYSYSSPTGVGSLYMLVNPTSGSNTVSVSCGGNCIGVSSSYSGAKQTGQPDASINTQTTGSGTGTSLTATVTVTAAGSWLVAGTVCEGSALTAGTGATLRITGANPAVALFDSNGAPGTGSQSMTVNESPANRFAMGMVSFAPAGTNYTQTITETLTLVEIISRQIGKVVVDTIALVENKILSMGRTITDVVVLTVVTGITNIYARATQDVLTLVDTITGRIAGFTHTEIITLQETLARAVGRAISEAATMQETVARGLVYARTILETATTVEVVAYIKSLGRVITEQITIVARVRSLLNGLDTRWIGKYASKAGTFISKYLDPKSS